MALFENIDTINLHHAYLIEGIRDEVIGEVLAFVKSLRVEVENNLDFSHISIDNFKIDEALDLRRMGTEKSFTAERKIFVLSANTFSLDAQQALLKLFEEPIPNTHFFVIVPETDALIRTLISRFHLLRDDSHVVDTTTASQFIKMPYIKRMDFIKELLSDVDEDDLRADSARTKSLKFLNRLETELHSKMKTDTKADYFRHIFKVREYLRQPGSATKTLMESVALIVPVLQ